jgi:glycosyltransferase involved in cell wall biosynthesis
MLRIGFDAKRLFNNATGLGNYSRTLVKGLREEFPQHAYHLFSPRIRRAAETEYFFGPGFKRRSPAAVPGPIWRSFLLRCDIADAAIDIYHGLSNELPFGIDASGTCAVVTIHDLLFHFYPEDYSWIDRRIYEAKFRYACAKAHRIIAVSESTRRDLMERYGVAEEKIAVVYQACDERFRREIGEAELGAVRSRYGLPAQYLLYVGTVNRRKNLLSLVKAMELVKGSSRLPLVAVGRGGEYKREVQKYVSDRGLADVVRFAPPVDPADLPAVYRRAKIVILPSRYEGFGLPIVEALASRVPVITSKVSSLPEAAGPGACYADPDKPESIAEGITKLLADPEYARRLAGEGHRYTQQFNAPDLSRKLMAVYEETLHQAGHGQTMPGEIPVPNS